jgi:hypothetical protein
MSDELSDYSEVADRQLDELHVADPDLYEDILTICELVSDHPSRARSTSAAVQTPDGIVFRLAVPGRFPRQGLLDVLRPAHRSGVPPPVATGSPRGCGDVSSASPEHLLPNSSTTDLHRRA